MFNRKRVLQIQLKTDWGDYSEDLPEQEKQGLLDRINAKQAELDAIEIKEQEECERLEEEQEQDRRDVIRGFHVNKLGY